MVAESTTPTRAGGAVLAVSCVSALIVNANTSAVTILLPAISQDVGTSTETLQWAVTGYSLVGAAVIVTGGALGDITGRRRVFVGALALFVVSCAIIGLAGSGAAVITGRAIQGAAGSTLLACGLSLLSVAADGTAQVRAVSLWGAASAVGAAVGPLIGGALVDSTGWQGLFWIDAAVAAVCIPVTLATVPESRDVTRPRTLDIGGTLLVAACLVPLVLALSLGTQWGWASAKTLVCLIASVAAAFGFVAVERRVKAPLVDLRLVRNKVLVGATLVILIVAGTINGLMYVMSLFFQNPAAFGMSPLEAGLATLPAAAGIVVIAPFVSGLAKKIGARSVILIGFVITTAGFIVLMFLKQSWGYGLFVLPLVAVAVGMGLSNGCASAAATSSVADRQVGEASGISNMARYVGAALLTAVTATIYGSATSGAADPGAAAVHGMVRTSLLMAIASGVGIALALLYGRYRPATARTVDQTSAAAGVVHSVPLPAAAPPSRTTLPG